MQNQGAYKKLFLFQFYMSVCSKSLKSSVQEGTNQQNQYLHKQRPMAQPSLHPRELWTQTIFLANFVVIQQSKTMQQETNKYNLPT
jgi:hypothetical protein